MIEEYADLMGTGHHVVETIAPEDEFFHSVYIAGQRRKNHIGIEEKPGHFQVRGVEYNLDNVYMIITHVKKVLVKSIRDVRTQKDRTECFSYQTGNPPWHGFNGRVCGNNAAERSTNVFCAPCKSQLIVAGIYCDVNGNPVLTEDKKPTFVFIRGKGMKYSGVSEYLDSLSKMELDPIFTPVTEETKRFEKNVVNNKRFVTKIGMGEADSQYGKKTVFKLETGVKLSTDKVQSILKLAKKTLEKFNEKFDDSKRAPSTATSSYAREEGTLPVDESNKFSMGDESAHPEEKPVEAAKSNGEAAPTFNFEDVDF
jgi:hypothetical protein